MVDLQIDIKCKLYIDGHLSCLNLFFNREIDKEYVACAYDGIFAATWIDLEIVILSEASQTEKDKYHMMLLICGILKKMVQMNLFTNQK